MVSQQPIITIYFTAMTFCLHHLSTSINPYYTITYNHLLSHYYTTLRRCTSAAAGVVHYGGQLFCLSFYSCCALSFNFNFFNLKNFQNYFGSYYQQLPLSFNYYNFLDLLTAINPHFPFQNQP